MLNKNILFIGQNLSSGIFAGDNLKNEIIVFTLWAKSFARAKGKFFNTEFPLRKWGKLLHLPSILACNTLIHRLVSQTDKRSHLNGKFDFA